MKRWRDLALRTRREEPICRINLPGCTRFSTTADHIIPVSLRPDLAFDRSNTAGACRSCNYRRGNIPWNQLPQLREAIATQQPADCEPQRRASFFDTAPRHTDDQSWTIGA